MLDMVYTAEKLAHQRREALETDSGKYRRPRIRARSR